jgi:hypothetical protein
MAPTANISQVSLRLWCAKRIVVGAPSFSVRDRLTHGASFAANDCGSIYDATKVSLSKKMKYCLFFTHSFGHSTAYLHSGLHHFCCRR